MTALQCCCSEPRPSASNVDVFAVDLADAALSGDSSFAILSLAEQQRAERFRQPHDRRRYVASHAALRLALSGRLNRPPENVAWLEGPFGKPFLPPWAGGDDVQFSLSRSGDVALIALSDGALVGVDIEVIADAANLSRLPFSELASSEGLALAALAPVERRDAFFHCWARKEAVLKAAGVGLRYNLKAFSAPIGRQPPGAAMSADVPGHGRWRLFDLPVGAGRAAAVAGTDADWRPCLRALG